MTKELSIAYRLLKNSYTQKSISSLVKICFFSILLSTTALTLITFIMNGFEKETYKIFKNIHSDILIRSNDQAIDDTKVAAVLNSEFKDQIFAYTPHGAAQIILQFKSNQTLMILKAIDPEKEFSVNNFGSMIKSSTPFAKSGILIGETLANKLGIKIGDKVNILYPQEYVKDTIQLGQSQAVISGVFNTGVEEYDQHILYTNFTFFNQIFDVGVHEIGLKIKNISDEKKVIENLKKRFTALEISSWKDLYPALISALSLEKYVMTIIVMLIMIIASINAISIIYIFMAQKRLELAILIANGFSEKSVIRICSFIALLITIPANILAILIGILISILIINFKIPLPPSYYVQHVPVDLNFDSIIFIFIFCLAISIITAWIPARKIRRLSLLDTLKSRN